MRSFRGCESAAIAAGSCTACPRKAGSLRLASLSEPSISIGVSALARSVLVVVVLGNVTFTAAAATETTNATPFVEPFFMLSGALLKDSFDGPQLDTNLWSRPPWLVENHKTIGVKIENGHLVISGPSHPEKQSHQYAGIISKYFRDTD